MLAVKPVQFLSALKPEVMLRMIRRMTTSDAIMVIDLEDALWDVVSPERTAKLKQQGRNDLVNFARKFPQTFRQRQIGVRLNRLGAEFLSDVESLVQIAGVATFDTVVLTKIESRNDLGACIERLTTNHIAYRNLVPIIETQAGIRNLDEILHEAQRQNIRHVVYGHYDFSLDAGHFPFLEFDESAFWEHVTPIIKRIEAEQLCYIHPPFFQMNDDARFTDSIRRLRDICKRPFGIITITERQTRRCHELAQWNSDLGRLPLRNAGFCSPEELGQSAQAITRSFEKNRRPSVSFAIDPESGRFISPHVYLAAVRYLEGP